ncbi:MAG: hypothetical protein RBQ91_03365 [Acholeplasma sp.]|nr:hypothetical protein [Acholeplasma sp.]
MRKLDLTPFDMSKKPIREKRIIMPLAWALSYPTVWKRKLKINKVNMEGLKPPYILLCTHHAFLDFKVTTAATFPTRLNFIVAIDGFLFGETLLRSVGAICKRKFTNDTKLYKHIKYVLDDLKGVVAIYPEARYSIVGTNANLPDSLGKLVKNLGYPVVVLNMHGNYLSQPQWNLKMKSNHKLTADMTQIISLDDINLVSVAEMNARIKEAFLYDEYKYQKDHKIQIKYPKRMEGIEAVLYQCPSCLKAHSMSTSLNIITCESCGKSYEQDEYGKLRALVGDTEFEHIPDWYEFERLQVRKEIENQSYYFEDDVYVESLPNAKGFHKLGKMKLIHDMNGFRLTGLIDNKPFELIKEPLSMYGLHIEYNYKGKGDCIDLSTTDNTYYIYPINQKQVVTKLHFAVEELYALKKKLI